MAPVGLTFSGPPEFGVTSSSASSPARREYSVAMDRGRGLRCGRASGESISRLSNKCRLPGVAAAPCLCRPGAPRTGRSPRENAPGVLLLPPIAWTPGRGRRAAGGLTGRRPRPVSRSSNRPLFRCGGLPSPRRARLVHHVLVLPARPPGQPEDEPGGEGAEDDERPGQEQQ